MGNEITENQGWNGEEITEGWGWDIEDYDGEIPRDVTIHYYYMHDEHYYKSACKVIGFVSDNMGWCDYLSFVSKRSYCSKCEKIVHQKDEKNKSADYDFMKELENL